MANLNVRTIYDHYWKESHPVMQSSIASQNPLYGIYSTACSLVAHSLLLVACISLLGIKRLPRPLDKFPVVGFYQQQWLDELDYIDTPHHKVYFAAARIIDGMRLVGNYNPLTIAYKTNAYKKGKTCSCQCQCECDGRCTNTTIC